ncbi:unnamed protein product [Vitrella brassicaformis CCMP3155]|uniref:Leucine-rich repeat-containing protein 51 n=1 Tax=Vitrella brassicaformis (strain CCMP3155) TaxID=1169540 RepID=A0A0G4GDJ4_VITBC|nr:unnamed protein product [Vitrella brassicaformis CCMP3155]|eukprot:CEM27252.1 unnamed protein product [Vitrella brassicaformis CCMP3155]
MASPTPGAQPAAVAAKSRYAGMTYGVGIVLDLQFKDITDLADCVEEPSNKDMALKCVNAALYSQGGASPGDAPPTTAPAASGHSPSPPPLPASSSDRPLPLSDSQPLPGSHHTSQRTGMAQSLPVSDGHTHATSQAAVSQSVGHGRGGGGGGVGSKERKLYIQKSITAARLNNNKLVHLTELPAFLSRFVINPLQSILWLDLSFNQLRGIDPVLVEFSELETLNLHCNQITKLSEVVKLRALRKLRTLSLLGNPIAISDKTHHFYRWYCIGALPSLKTFDHTLTSYEDRYAAVEWFRVHLIREQRRREEAERRAELLAAQQG